MPVSRLQFYPAPDGRIQRRGSASYRSLEGRGRRPGSVPSLVPVSRNRRTRSPSGIGRHPAARCVCGAATALSASCRFPHSYTSGAVRQCDSSWRTRSRRRGGSTARRCRSESVAGRGNVPDRERAPARSHGLDQGGLRGGLAARHLDSKSSVRVRPLSREARSDHLPCRRGPRNEPRRPRVRRGRRRRRARWTSSWSTGR